MKINKQIGNRGFTLVELMIVIVIIGVLAALASFGFIEYVKKSKSAEADEFVKKIGDGAKIYYTSEQHYGGDENAWHAATSSGNSVAGMPVPGSAKVFPGGAGKGLIWTADLPGGGGKVNPYVPGGTPTALDPVWATFLNFTTKDPTYFHYGYQTPSGTGSDAEACVVAEADFDNKSNGVSAVTDACDPSAVVDNQILYKKLTVDGGDVKTPPPVLKNQGK